MKMNDEKLIRMFVNVNQKRFKSFFNRFLFFFCMEYGDSLRNKKSVIFFTTRIAMHFSIFFFLAISVTTYKN